jgi:hypothetical protein
MPQTGSPARPRRWPSPDELNRFPRLDAQISSAAARNAGPRGRTGAPRDELRRQVREVAAIAADDADFFARLRHAGLFVRLPRSTPTMARLIAVIGAVSRDQDTTATLY